MRIVTWNVNGIRAVVSSHKRGGGLRELLQSTGADILCVQVRPCQASLRYDAFKWVVVST
jgi:exonuclease III